MSDQLRKPFWKKLKEEGRSFAWFHRNYLKDAGLSYNTLYKQAKGQELVEMSSRLKKEMAKFTGV